MLMLLVPLSGNIKFTQTNQLKPFENGIYIKLFEVEVDRIFFSDTRHFVTEYNS
jgi:hypothetical protein